MSVTQSFLNEECSKCHNDDDGVYRQIAVLNRDGKILSTSRYCEMCYRSLDKADITDNLRLV